MRKNLLGVESRASHEERRLKRINKNDSVCVALEDVAAGSEAFGVKILENVLFGHKIALKNIASGENIIKYGAPIGHATQDIPKGAHVHVHNCATNLKGMEDYSYNPVNAPPKKIIANKSQSEFQGYRRAFGKVGIRNEIWIINTVGCVNKTSERLAAKAKLIDGVDGVHAFVHPYGCSQLGEDHKHTRDVLINLALHPNAGGVLVLGLGCENNGIEAFKEALAETGELDPERILFLNAQDVQNEEKEGARLLEKLIKYAANFKRESIPVSELIIGLKCGGSDGLSGITANPLIGAFSDAIISEGGSALLTEVPEMFGAETLLMNRAVSREVFDKTVELINGFKKYFLRYGQEVYENPSPGNKTGGITTLEDKSLGCTQKGGESLVTDALNYGERLRTRGLNLLQGPGNDIVACTNLAAAGAHIILFSTGRGTPLGGPVPTFKISSSTALFNKKSAWLDYDAEFYIENAELAAKNFYDCIMATASGRLTKNEINGYREISIFKDGVIL